MTLALILGICAAVSSAPLDAYAYRSPQSAQTHQAPENPPVQEPKPAESAPSQKPDAPDSQVQAPTASTPPSTVQPPTEEKKTEATVPKSKAVKHRVKKAKGKKKLTDGPSGPKKVVVREGGAADPATTLTPGMPNDQANYSRQTTSQVLSSTENNLKQASARTLNSNQAAMVEQIKTFMDQANAAVNKGDFQRGHNLAVKAYLLSNDLLKH